MKMLQGMSTDPKAHINMGIFQNVVCRIPLVLGLLAEMQDPYVYVVFGPVKTRQFSGILLFFLGGGS